MNENEVAISFVLTVFGAWLGAFIAMLTLPISQIQATEIIFRFILTSSILGILSFLAYQMWHLVSSFLSNPGNLSTFITVLSEITIVETVFYLFLEHRLNPVLVIVLVVLALLGGMPLYVFFREIQH